MAEPTELYPLAFYLPQYHPIPENDEWWGKGFTEWRNVVRARPQFKGHYQPHLPADLGFYDLRVPEVRQQQAELARAAGIRGFVYYHYWFNGRRLLERPLAEVRSSGEPDFPFCIAWANENWTRRWDGSESEVLLAQAHSPEDDLEHIRALRELLADPRYVTAGGKPVILIYRSSLLPHPAATLEIWREEAERWGLPGLYLLRVESFPDETGDPAPLGFDAAVAFEPKWWRVLSRPSPASRVRRRLGSYRDRWSHDIVPYRQMAHAAMSESDPAYARWPSVTPSWDNTARRQRNAFILSHPDPSMYSSWLCSTIARAEGQRPAGDKRFLFINAWNEWAEGNHLEPDSEFGHAYLDATRAALLGTSEHAS